VKRVVSPTEVEVTWAASGASAQVAIGVAGVLPLGPALLVAPVGTRVVRGPDWSAGDEDGGGPGTVVTELGGEAVMVHWDSGRRRRYRIGGDALVELALSRAPLPTLKVGAKIEGAPACTSCVRGGGEVAKVLGKGKVKVTWFDGTQSDVAVGATGVLPRGDVPASMAVGVRVRRGPDWKWGDQDIANGGTGTGIVTSVPDGLVGWVNVDWIGGDSNGYRWGFEDAYDLEIVGS
jgi:hypothetical protein